MNKKIHSVMMLTLLLIGLLNVTFGGVSTMTQLYEHVIVNTGADGLYPSVYENIIAFVTREDLSHVDLNGDGDIDDSIIQYYDISSEELTNTGIEGYGGEKPSIYENMIAFSFRPLVGSIKYYDISTEILTDVGISGVDPAVYEDIIAFMDDHHVIRYYNISTGMLRSTFVKGGYSSIYENIIAFTTPESIEGRDLNGDGDTLDSIVRFYDISTGSLTNTGVDGHYEISIYGNIIALQTSEDQAGMDLNGDGDKNDFIIRYYDISTGILVNTGIQGRSPSIYGTLIAFYSYPSRIDYYDISTGTFVNTGVVGSHPSIYKNTLAFYTGERYVGDDLNGDGDIEDFVIRYLTLIPPTPTTIDELKTEIEELGRQGNIDNEGIVKSLLAKLNVAQKLVDKGKIDEAKGILEEDFIPQVQNLSGIHITPEAAEILIESAEYIISHL